MSKPNLIGQKVLSSDTKFHTQSIGIILKLHESKEYPLYVEWEDNNHKDGWYRKSALILDEKRTQESK